VSNRKLTLTHEEGIFSNIQVALTDDYFSLYEPKSLVVKLTHSTKIIDAVIQIFSNLNLEKRL
jgi:hypothetical protein